MPFVKNSNIKAVRQLGMLPEFSKDNPCNTCIKEHQISLLFLHGSLKRYMKRHLHTMQIRLYHHIAMHSITG